MQQEQELRISRLLEDKDVELAMEQEMDEAYLRQIEQCHQDLDASLWKETNTLLFDQQRDLYLLLRYTKYKDCVTRIIERQKEINQNFLHLMDDYQNKK